MMGQHCIKTRSKTQAIVAKSSAEAELYGVVRGATEALGLSTLLQDLGQESQIRLHVDAAAAKGIIERKGLSKVRHLDVNVLWLQETAARKEIPINKIPGEENPADLATKHLATAKVEKLLGKMYMSHKEGRASKAAKLHSLRSKGQGGAPGQEEEIKKAMSLLDGAGDAWSGIRRIGNDARGGDRWKSRGHEGTWHRWHTTPRRSLFTPYRVSKGPGKDVPLRSSRFTCGVTQSGKKFELYDDWTRPDRRHMLLDEPWMGYTVFTVEGASYVDFQRARNGEDRPVVGRWSDIVE